MCSTQNDVERVRIFERTVSRIFEKHMRKLTSIDNVQESPRLMRLLDCLEGLYGRIALVIADRVLQTYEDSEARSWSEISEESELLLEVSIIPCDWRDGRAYFEKRYPSPGYGYSHTLNEILNSNQARSAADQGVSTLAHLIFCCDLHGASLSDLKGSTLGVQLTIVPLLEELAPSAAGAIIATDLLTELEKRRFDV